MKRGYEATTVVEPRELGFRWPIYRYSGARTLSRFSDAQRLSGLANGILRVFPWFALALANRAVKLVPDDPQFMNGRCLALLEVGMYNEALEDINRVIEMVPDFFGSYITQANIRIILGDGRGVSESFRWAGILAKNDKELALVFYQMGVWVARLSDDDSARKFFRDASELDPGNQKYAFLARVRRISKEEQEAEKTKIVLAG